MNFVNFVVVTELANSTFLVLNIERKRLLLIFFLFFYFFVSLPNKTIRN